MGAAWLSMDVAWLSGGCGVAKFEYSLDKSGCGVTTVNLNAAWLCLGAAWLS